MATSEITCAACGAKSRKENREINRRTRLGRLMYCNLHCAGKHLARNLPSGSGFVKGSASQIKAVEAARIANTKYSQSEKIFNEYIRRATKRKKHDCNITIEYLADLWERQKGRCALTNIRLVHVTQTDNFNIMASLDRIKSDRGYIMGNVQFVCCAINLAKREKSDEAMHQFISLIVENYPLRNA